MVEVEFFIFLVSVWAFYVINLERTISILSDSKNWLCTCFDFLVSFILTIFFHRSWLFFFLPNQSTIFFQKIPTTSNHQSNGSCILLLSESINFKTSEIKTVYLVIHQVVFKWFFSGLLMLLEIKSNNWQQGLSGQV